jgi:hypothetical protein
VSDLERIRNFKSPESLLLAEAATKA